MRLRPLVLAMALAMLPGCACKLPHYQTVPVSCVKSEPVRDASEFDKVPDADIATQVRALLIDRDVTDIYIGGLESIVAGCR